MLNDGKYATPLLVEATLLCMFVIGLVFLFNPGTDIMGWIIVFISQLSLFITVTYNVLRVHREDLIAFSLFASIGLTLVSIMFCVLFYDRVQRTNDVFNNTAVLDGIPKDLLFLFKTIFVSIFVFTAILYYIYLRQQEIPSKPLDAAALTKVLFSLYRDDVINITPGEDDYKRRLRLISEKSYVVSATILSLLLLALSSYSIYVTNLLKSINLLN